MACPIFAILPAAALRLFVQPAVQQPVSGNGIGMGSKTPRWRSSNASSSPSFTGGRSATDDPVTDGAAVGSVIEAAAARAVIAVAAKDGGWGLDQAGVVLIIGAAGGAMVGAGVDAMLHQSVRSEGHLAGVACAAAVITVVDRHGDRRLAQFETPVPEPTSLLLVGSGMMLWAGVRHRAGCRRS